MDFVAIDFETANEDLSSICQIGLAEFRGGRLINGWRSYVDPCGRFAGINVSIHGIRPETVIGAPKFGEIADRVFADIRGKIVATHTAFDRAALRKAALSCGSPVPEVHWLDTACVARRTWLEIARGGYGLASVCEMIGYKFNHHDALEDAKAAGEVLLAAIRESGMPLDQWLVRVTQPIDPASALPLHRLGNPEGILFGEVIVFTGTLTVSRGEAADLAASVGCEVDAGVTKRTTILVVGTQNLDRLAGYEKSSKQRKAEKLIASGNRIRVIFEDDFKSMVENAMPWLPPP